MLPIRSIAASGDGSSDPVIGVVIGDLRKVFEGLQIIMRHTIANGVHLAKLPQREHMTVAGRKLESACGTKLVARIVVHDPRPDRVAGGRKWRKRHRLRSTRRWRENGPRPHDTTGNLLSQRGKRQPTDHKYKCELRYPHSNVFLPRRQDVSQPHRALTQPDRRTSTVRRR